MALSLSQPPAPGGDAVEAPAASHSKVDASLQHFRDPSFDPVDFLNDSLPPLTLAASQPHASRTPGAVTLAELSSRTQLLLSQLGTQNIRLSGTLTQLTDEILRSGGRLAYEVELLRGETIGLADTLTETLHGDITKFAPERLQTNGNHEYDAEGNQEQTEPQFITQLRTLSKVRARLEEVVQAFGDAMEWPLPPSELSLTSSFISVSAPDPGSESHSREEKGQEVVRKLRTEITELLDSNDGGTSGVAAATVRLQALRDLAAVWKGTAEEKARNRILDSLTKMVEDRRKTLDSQPSRIGRSSIEQSVAEQGNDDSGGPGGGLFRNLQRIRDEIYLE
jgi:hypothetical protein